MYLASHSLNSCLQLTGNFIGKGGAHADGTKSSGDKVQHISRSSLHLTCIRYSLNIFWRAICLATTISIFHHSNEHIPFYHSLNPPYFRTLSSHPSSKSFSFNFSFQGSGLASYVASLIDTTLTWNDIAWLRFVTVYVIFIPLLFLLLITVSSPLFVPSYSLTPPKNLSRPAISTSHLSTWTLTLILSSFLDMTERTQQ